MITGYNTEVPSGGVSYHVQTEDMGKEYGKIITHVFVGGAILFSKKTGYGVQDGASMDDGKVKDLMVEQHRKFVRIIQVGKIDVLKQKSDAAEMREAAMSSTAAAAVASAEAPPAQRPPEHQRDVSSQAGHSAQAAQKKLKIEVVGGVGIVSGQWSVLRIYTKESPSGMPIPDCKVVIKVVGMTFRPVIHSGRTDSNGVYTLNIEIPETYGSQATVVVQAIGDLGSDEVKLRVEKKPK